MQDEMVMDKQDNLLKNGEIITSLQKQYFQRDGFLVLKNVISADICHALMKRANEMVDEFEMHGTNTIFSTINQQHAKHQYFLDSGDKIHFFFEEGAFDASGNLQVDKQFCINKIGHGLHEADALFNCFSRQHKLAALTNDLGYHDAKLVQSMYIFKQPRIGGEVTCHQDATYLATTGEPVVGLWLALEDATLENGCLWAIPGGHKGVLKSRFIRDKNDRTYTETFDNSPWELEKLIPLEVPRGSLIVLHGLLPHMSKENKSDKSRHAYALHVMSGQTTFCDDNWLQLPEGKSFKGFL